jgi:endonuclease/exonuclease/phosphatase family metal-dependent hydrolase
LPSVFSQPDTRIMTYNIKVGSDLHQWEQRKAVLTETIRQQQPTVLGTQEGLEFQIAYVRDDLRHFEMHGEGRDPMLGGEYCAVFVDKRVAEVETSGTFWLSDNPEVPGSRMVDENLPRVATWVRMLVRGTPLLFVNTHLTYLEEGIPAQMMVLVQELEKLIDPTVETIITGDFNIGRQREPMAHLRTLGFADAWSIAAEASGPLFTFPGWDVWDDARIDSVMDENRIDWVCIRPPDGETTPAVTVETVHTHRVDPVPSDHFPVVVAAF